MRRVLLAFESTRGGAAENVLQLAEGLPAHGYEVELAGPPGAEIYPRLPAGAAEPHVISLARGYNHPREDAAALRGLARLARRGNYDLLHCHSAKAGVVGRLAGRTAGVPVVYSPHCFSFIGDFSAKRRLVATAIERGLAPLSAAIVCVSEDERRRGAEAGIAERRMRVVPNGSGPPPAVEPDPRLVALREAGPLAAAIAVMRKQKRLDVFLDAVPHVWAELPEARLAVVGEGPDRPELEAQARRLGLLDDERFAFIAFEPPSARYLQALDVYVLSSSWEGLPIAILEALSCGVPQVATAVGGTPEAINADTGLLVPPEDPRALGHAIAELLGDRERRARMSEASRERWARDFSLERAVADTAAVYDSVLGG